jgi:hypothetical protein
MAKVNDFLAWNDADLFAYLQENKQPDGSVDMSHVKGFEELSEEQKDELAVKFG